MSEDRYSQDEVAAILKRSAEIESERRKGAQAAGLSLADLERIAEESGLDPGSVRTAARELADADSPAPLEKVAGPLSGSLLHHRRTLAGELGEEKLEQLVQQAGTRLHLPGRITRKRNSWQWTERLGRRRLRVRAESGHGRTKIEVDEDLRRLAGALYGGVIGGLGGVGFALSFLFGFSVESTVAGALTLAALGTLGALTAGFGIARTLFRRHRLLRDVELERLANELEQEGRVLVSDIDVDARSVTEDTEREPVHTPLHREPRRRDKDEDDRRRRRGRKRGRSRD